MPDAAALSRAAGRVTRLTRNGGTLRGMPPLTIDALAEQYTDEIQLAPPQIEMIANTVRGRAPGCRLLVFGLGRDAGMWQRLNADGCTLFVEDNEHWARHALQRHPDLQVLRVSYAGRTVAGSLPLDAAARKGLAAFPLPPELERTDWDVIVVDAPFGFDAGCPGRSVPLHWTRQLMGPHTHVFVDDYERPLERAYTDALIAPRCAHRLVVRRPGHEMFWGLGLNSGFAGWSVVDAGGRAQRLRWLLNTTRLRLLWFHDSVEVIPQLAACGLLDARTHLLFSFSWHRDEAALRHLRRLLSSDGVVQRAAQLHFLLNSAEELAAFRSLVPGFDAMHFNNASLIDPQRFVPATGARRFHAVLNAKPLAFKRHELSVQVPERLFVTYDVQERDEGATRRVDLDALGAREIRRNLSAEGVSAALGEADVGLMLSAAEGACYASLEYLLCGLPVVSTRTLGGRDEFYDPAHSRIVDDDPAAVRDAVADLRARLARGDITREAVRTRALARRRAFLDALAARLQAVIDAAGLPLQAARLLDEAIAEGSKLQRHRNFWVAQLRPPGHVTPLSATDA